MLNPETRSENQTPFLPYAKNPLSNPYHHRLEEFDHFVFRNEESEHFQGRWHQDVFQNMAPLHVEIGSGAGHFMYEFCRDFPDQNFVGLDYRFKRSYMLAKKMSQLPTANFRYLRAWGERLAFTFAESEVDSLYYFFPDPWPKKRHQKKRLFQRDFLQAVYKVLRPGGIFYIKTDHDELFDWMLCILQDPTLASLFSVEMMSRDLHREYPEHFLAQYETQFEKIFKKQGIHIKSMVLKSLKQV